MNEKFFKDVKKRLIDIGKTFTWLAEQTGYTTPWGLRQAIKSNQKKAIQKVEEILKIKAN